MSDDLYLSGSTSDGCMRVAASGRPGSGWLVLALPAEIDIANAEEVLADLLAAIESGSPVVVADMSMTAFCDCAGVRALLTAGSHALQAGVQVRVVAQSAPVLRTFGLTGLDAALPVYPTSSAALDQADDAIAGQEPCATVTELSPRRRTGRAESGRQRGRQRCP